MKKKKQQKNYLDLIPERNAALVWTQIAQKLFKRPKVTKVHMEKYGSFLWPLIDGRRTVMELADLQKAEFGEEVEPLYPRVVKYMQIMESYHFIGFRESV